jgi:hypothetical protein
MPILIQMKKEIDKSDNETSCAFAAARLAIVRMAAEIGKVVV